MWAGYFGWFPPPPTPSNHTPTSLATSRRALSPSIVLFGRSLTPPASSLHFLPALTVYSSLSCFSTSVSPSGRTRVGSKSTRLVPTLASPPHVSITTADASSQGRTGLWPPTQTNLTNSFLFSTTASAVGFRPVPLLTYLLIPVRTFRRFCSFPSSEEHFSVCDFSVIQAQIQHYDIRLKT